MSGVVVGMKGAWDAGPAVRWASAEAVLRGLPLRLVHAWHEPLDVSVDIGRDSLPDLLGDATCHAVHGPVGAALLAQAPDVLVLGDRAGTGQLSAVARYCLRHAGCPVVIVPQAERPSTGCVLVGVGYGDTSRNALRWAADEVRRRQGRLVVVHAWQAHVATAKDLFRPARTIPAQRDAAHDRLRSWVRDVVGEIDAEVNAAHGGPLDALLQFSARADLMVIGRAGRSGFRGALHDLIGNDLGGLAPCPIVFIPGRSPTGGV